MRLDPGIFLFAIHSMGKTSNELFTVDDPRHITVHNVGKLNLGYSFDFVRSGWLGLGAGVAGSVHFLPAELGAAYGETPVSFYGFVRARLR